MSNKHYIGQDLVSFSDNGRYRPISRVTLLVDDENSFTAGDDTGLEVVGSCAYATQAMADALLASMRGYEYQPFDAGDANIDPAAELGDGVTVGGIYSMLCSVSDDGNGYPSLAAPGEAELEDEFPSAGPATREFNRKLAETRSLIAKTSEEIILSVENLSKDMGQTLRVAADGVTITNADGDTLEIDGGQIKASSITSDQIKAGAITADKIAAESITASNLLGSSVGLLNSSETQVGELSITGSTAAKYAIELYSRGSLRLEANWGNLFLTNTRYADTNWIGLDGLDVIVSCTALYPSGTAANLGDPDGGMWEAVYSYTGAIQTSDANLKNSIESLPQKYVDFVLWVEPKRFKMNNGTSDRYHPGFIAQNVKEGMDLFGIDSQEFGGWCKDTDALGNEIYMLRYEEFIAPMLAAIRDHEARLKKLEG